MNHEGQAVIYKIVNVMNAKFYVGSTVNFLTRRRKHLRELRKGVHHCPALQASWKKHGEDAFVFRVVEVVEDAAHLHAIEQKWLDEHHGKEYCYNYARYTDNPNRGRPLGESHSRAIAEGVRRFYANNPSPNLGKKHSEEAKAKMRKNRAGKPVSELTKDLIRQSRLGTKASEETRAKLSAMRKGKVKSDAHLAKYNKPIMEVSSGIIYPSLKAVKEAFDMSPGMLAKALAADRPLLRGKNAGRHFKYVDPVSQG